jgi:hypothetical protein
MEVQAKYHYKNSTSVQSNIPWAQNLESFLRGWKIFQLPSGCTKHVACGLLLVQLAMLN